MKPAYAPLTSICMPLRYQAAARVEDAMDFIDQLVHWLAGLYDQYGYALVLGGTFVENTAILGLLLPGNTMALLGAILSTPGDTLTWLGDSRRVGGDRAWLPRRLSAGPLRARWHPRTLGR